MRAIALFIALVLSALALAPGGVLLSSAADETPALQTLDICHPSSGGMNVDAPYLLCCPGMSLPLRLAGMAPAFIAPAKQSLLAFQDERPPKFLLV